jgi:hypothetical protein
LLDSVYVIQNNKFLLGFGVITAIYNINKQSGAEKESSILRKNSCLKE